MFYRSFNALLDDYDVIPDEDIRLHEWKLSTITDAAKRREVKISHYKKELALKNDIQVRHSSIYKHGNVD